MASFHAWQQVIDMFLLFSFCFNAFEMRLIHKTGMNDLLTISVFHSALKEKSCLDYFTLLLCSC